MSPSGVTSSLPIGSGRSAFASSVNASTRRSTSPVRVRNSVPSAPTSRPGRAVAAARNARRRGRSPEVELDLPARSARCAKSSCRRRAGHDAVRRPRTVGPSSPHRLPSRRERFAAAVCVRLEGDTRTARRPRCASARACRAAPSTKFRSSLTRSPRLRPNCLRYASMNGPGRRPSPAARRGPSARCDGRSPWCTAGRRRSGSGCRSDVGLGRLQLAPSPLLLLERALVERGLQHLHRRRAVLVLVRSCWQATTIPSAGASAAPRAASCSRAGRLRPRRGTRRSPRPRRGSRSDAVVHHRVDEDGGERRMAPRRASKGEMRTRRCTPRSAFR